MIPSSFILLIPFVFVGFSVLWAKGLARFASSLQRLVSIYALLVFSIQAEALPCLHRKSVADPLRADNRSSSKERSYKRFGRVRGVNSGGHSCSKRKERRISTTSGSAGSADTAPMSGTTPE